MRVLTFGRFADEDFGGLERYVFSLAAALRDEVHFTNIVASRGEAPDVQLACDVVYARAVTEIGGVPVCPSMIWHALRLHRRKPFDIVHLQFPADPAAHAATVLLPPSVKRVITWHSDIVRQRRLLRIYRPFLERLVRSAAAIILPTRAHLSSSEQLQMGEEQGKFRIVPFGFDLSRFEQRPPLADEIRARHQDRFLIFALGRHVYYKGFEFLIRALQHIPEAHLLLGGQGPLTGQLTRLRAELGLEKRVEFLGRIPEVELAAYYHACDVFCMPSIEYAEAFGIVQVEAMASSRPVVSCDLRNGVTYVNRHGETGLVVPPKEVAGLAGALLRLRDDPELRARLGMQAKRRVIGEFTIDAMRAGTLAVYREVIHAAPGL